MIQSMQEWIEGISDYIKEKETLSSPLADLSEEICQAALETEMLVDFSEELQSVISALAGKIEHANS